MKTERQEESISASFPNSEPFLVILRVSKEENADEVVSVSPPLVVRKAVLRMSRTFLETSRAFMSKLPCAASALIRKAEKLTKAEKKGVRSFVLAFAIRKRKGSGLLF